jgi:SAM-dependent methyltransferase
MEIWEDRLRPVARRLLRLVKTAPLRLAGAEQLFADIYRRNAWRGMESSSGPGSGRAETAAVRRGLPRLLAELGCRSLLDAPCGDYHWMSQTPLALDQYFGADIVPEIVARNRRRHGDETRRFLCLDIRSATLPRVDLVLCRDGLVHFSDRDVWRALANFERSGSTWLLATTFPGRTENPVIVTGEWRPLNLEAAPFELPAPLRRLDERYLLEDGRFADKSLALWPLAGITRGRA